MRRTIDIDVHIDPRYNDPKVIIKTDRMTPEVENLVSAIENYIDSRYPPVSAFDRDRMMLISQREIIRVFLENRKLVVHTAQGDFVARKSLSELELLLNHNRFLRISRSEIINLYQVSSFDFSLSGTIHVHFDDGSHTWVSRRYVRSIQETLGLI